jgi:ABC-type sugar transport system ATPase subunit
LSAQNRKVDIATPRQAMNLGIETIYQTNSMVPTMSIARNLFVGREPLMASVFGFGFGFMDHRRMRHEASRRSPTSTCICVHPTRLSTLATRRRHRRRISPIGECLEGKIPQRRVEQPGLVGSGAQVRGNWRR